MAEPDPPPVGDHHVQRVGRLANGLRPLLGHPGGRRGPSLDGAHDLRVQGDGPGHGQGAQLDLLFGLRAQDQHLKDEPDQQDEDQNGDLEQHRPGGKPQGPGMHLVTIRPIHRFEQR